ATGICRATRSSIEARIDSGDSEEFRAVPGAHRSTRCGTEPTLAAIRGFAPAAAQKPQLAGARTLILRDAIVSSERHRLGVVETARPEPQPESLRPALTVSEVCAWLMGESE